MSKTKMLLFVSVFSVSGTYKIWLGIKWLHSVSSGI